MVRRDTETRPTPLRTLLVVGLLLVCAGASAQQRLRAGGSGPLEAVLSRAILEAQTRLDGAVCRGVFSDFQTEDGRTLQETLDAAGASGGQYLASLVFFDGSGRRTCEDRGTLASTSPNSRVIYVCGSQFLGVLRGDPGLAAALLIHEELHSLGLGENPPTSKHITARVIERCGR